MKKSFNEYKEQILSELNRRQKANELNIGEPTDLVEGFVMQQLQESVDTFVFGGRVVPTFLLVGKKTGRVYTFAVKSFVTDFEM